MHSVETGSVFSLLPLLNFWASMCIDNKIVSIFAGNGTLAQTCLSNGQPTREGFQLKTRVEGAFVSHGVLIDGWIKSFRLLNKSFSEFSTATGVSATLSMILGKENC